METLEQLLKHSLVENTPTVLGTPNYRPLLLLEEGEITLWCARGAGASRWSAWWDLRPSSCIFSSCGW